VFAIEYTLRAFDASIYTQVEQVKHLRLNELAIATLTPTLASGLLLIALQRHGAVFFLTVVGLLCAVGALVITLRVNVPINAEQMTWNVKAPPSNWVAVRDRWQRAHAARTVLAVGGFCCQIIAAVLV
jgi:uncharacterized membrane protein